MSVREVAEWQVYFNEEPWGHEIEELRMATMMAMMHNQFAALKAQIVTIVSGKRVNPKQKSVEDFLPKAPGQAKDPKSLLEKVKMLNRMFGGIETQAGGE